MKICKGWLQALLSPAPRGFVACSRILARLASLAQIGELARRLTGQQCDEAWVDATLTVVKIMHCTWLQFVAPPASQTPPCHAHLC